MAFYKAQKMKTNGKYYPQAVLVDEPFTTDQLAERLADISTVSVADVYAVLKNLPAVMADMMDAGRSVRLEGLGTFRYTINSAKQGVDKPEDVTDAQIVGVRVRYTPETKRPTKGTATRALVPDDLRWVRYDGTPVPDDEDDDQGSGGEDPLPGA